MRRVTESRSGRIRIDVGATFDLPIRLAIAAGANVKAVQRKLDHTSAAMTLDVYADLFDDLDAGAIALDRARIRTKGVQMFPQTGHERGFMGKKEWWDCGLAA